MLNLILTGTIDPSIFSNTGVVLTNAEERLKQYKSAIHFYITNSPFENIIFIENSGSPFNFKEISNQANKYNKKFEYIKVETDKEETLKYGKSYGEADLITKAILQSNLLKGEISFYKVTGRIKIINIKKMILSNNDSAFLFRHDLKRCYTFFFKANINQYKKYFINSQYLCDEKRGYDIERVYYDIIMKNDLNVTNYKFYPLLKGTIGTNGLQYGDNCFVFYIKNILTFLGLYNKHGNRIILKCLAFSRLLMFKKV